MLIPKGELERIRRDYEHQQKVEAEYIERLTDIVAEKVHRNYILSFWISLILSL